MANCAHSKAIAVLLNLKKQTTHKTITALLEVLTEVAGNQGLFYIHITRLDELSVFSISSSCHSCFCGKTCDIYTVVLLLVVHNSLSIINKLELGVLIM